MSVYVCICVFFSQNRKDMGLDMDMSDLKRMTTANGLEALLLFWIMEDIDFTTIDYDDEIDIDDL